MKPRRPDLHLEMAYQAQGIALVAGLDEAGRGAWAGPVSAGAVILPPDDRALRRALKGVRDSKLCTPRQRDQLDVLVRETALGVAVGMASQEEIDAMGISPATRLAMRRAVEGLAEMPGALLIDYVRLRDVDLPQRSFPKGESVSLSIAAASIVAKVARDRLMIALDERYPGFGFAVHKGYGTKIHQDALNALGPSPVHRKSFAPIRTLLMETEDESGDRA